MRGRHEGEGYRRRAASLLCVMRAANGAWILKTTGELATRTSDFSFPLDSTINRPLAVSLTLTTGLAAQRRSQREPLQSSIRR